MKAIALLTLAILALPLAIGSLVTAWRLLHFADDEAGFLGVVGYLVCWALVMPVMVTVCVVGGLIWLYTGGWRLWLGQEPRPVD